MSAELLPPLWTCPKCGAKFVTANIWHACGRYRVEDLFAKSDAQVFRLYEKYRRMVEACGPVVVIPQKTRLVFMVRMRFAGVSPRKSHLRCSFLLTRRLGQDSRIVQVQAFSPRSIGYTLRIERTDQLDATVQNWLKEAYDVGAQKDFVRHGNAARRGPVLVSEAGKDDG